MKKVISLLFAIPLCLGLCACAKSTDNTTEASAEAVAQTHPLLSNIYGSWTMTDPESGHTKNPPFLSFTINEDGSCLAGDKTGTWEINKTSYDNEEKYLWLDLFYDGGYQYCISYHLHEGREMLDIGWTAGTFMTTGGFTRAS